MHGPMNVKITLNIQQATRCKIPEDFKCLKTQCLQRQIDCNTDYFSETTGIPAAIYYANQNIKKVKKKPLPVFVSVSSNCAKYLWCRCYSARY